MKRIVTFEYGCHYSRDSGGDPLDYGTKRKTLVTDCKPQEILSKIEDWLKNEYKDGFLVVDNYWITLIYDITD